MGGHTEPLVWALQKPQWSSCPPHLEPKSSQEGCACFREPGSLPQGRTEDTLGQCRWPKTGPEGSQGPGCAHCQRFLCCSCPFASLHRRLTAASLRGQAVHGLCRRGGRGWGVSLVSGPLLSLLAHTTQCHALPRPPTPHPPHTLASSHTLMCVSLTHGLSLPLSRPCLS